jgi:hypothetical protein
LRRYHNSINLNPSPPSGLGKYGVLGRCKHARELKARCWFPRFKFQKKTKGKQDRPGIASHVCQNKSHGLLLLFIVGSSSHRARSWRARVQLCSAVTLLLWIRDGNAPIGVNHEAENPCQGSATGGHVDRRICGRHYLCGLGYLNRASTITCVVCPRYCYNQYSGRYCSLGIVRSTTGIGITDTWKGLNRGLYAGKRQRDDMRSVHIPEND